ncbi:MAG: sigma-54 dependent transcriptional regulator [Deltaproteobacteria bacterium]|nr:sigma-54 dependent transcriptional regulator [Deltaproteobacteria bacterium]
MLKQLLMIGDSKRYRSLLIALHDLGINVEQIPSDDDLIAVSTKPYAAVLMEWDPFSSSRMETLKKIRRMWPKLPVVGLGTDSGARTGRTGQMGKGADHVLLTGDENKDLARLLDSLKRVIPELRGQVLAVKDLLSITTRNENMQQVIALIDIIKDIPSSVLIQGENGTGKEVIAKLLHQSGRRSAEPFVAINCAAIPETLLESELFGHEKGSFTGATEKRIGKFELAHHGTAFLDEIGDMPLNTQAKILRVLETQQIEPVGGQNQIQVDVRIVAATNQDLIQQIENGRFRQDLYYRINTFSINLPPLRERKEDVLPLAQHFLDTFATRRAGGPRKRLSPEAESLLLNYNWPGNVRELRNAMERAGVLSAGKVIGPEIFSEEIRFGRSHAMPPIEQPQGSIASTTLPPRVVPIRELERRAIIEALSHLGNNVSEAAKQLGISRASLYRKLKKYGIKQTE